MDLILSLKLVKDNALRVGIGIEFHSLGGILKLLAVLYILHRNSLVIRSPPSCIGFSPDVKLCSCNFGSDRSSDMATLYSPFVICRLSFTFYTVTILPLHLLSDDQTDLSKCYFVFVCDFGIVNCQI